MKINTLLDFLTLPRKKQNLKISAIVTSTKMIKRNCVLLLVKGINIDPELFLSEQDASKCLLILSNNKESKFIYYPLLKEKLFLILDYFYFNFIHPFKIIAITGSEGKSSLSDIIYQGLTNAKKKVLMIATEKRHKDIYLSKLTTPSSYEIILSMLKAKKENYQYLILEVSSIGISEKRIALEIFDFIFLTNLEVDHLDYHKTILNYHLTKISLLLNNAKAKKFMFKSTYLKYKELFMYVNNLKIIDENKINVISANLSTQEFIYENKRYQTKLLFKQNILNLIFLIELLKKLKITSFKKVINNINRVKGRLDIINNSILIDYAHSIKSMENVLKNIKSLTNKKIVLIFGAGGNRDILKRKVYGDIALKYAHKIILTNDNPRDEDEYKIINDIINKRNGFIIIKSRALAIKKAIKNLKEHELVVILGRGNETYQYLKNYKRKLNDYNLVYTYLKKLNI